MLALNTPIQWFLLKFLQDLVKISIFNLSNASSPIIYLKAPKQDGQTHNQPHPLLLGLPFLSRRFFVKKGVDSFSYSRSYSNFLLSLIYHLPFPEVKMLIWVEEQTLLNNKGTQIHNTELTQNLGFILVYHSCHNTIPQNRTLVTIFVNLV